MNNLEVAPKPEADQQNVEEVRVLATGRDGSLTCKVLARAKIKARACPTLENLVQDLESAHVLILAEELLTGSNLSRLVEQLAAQPAWSDLPVIVVARPKGQVSQTLWQVKGLGNVSVLTRPLNITSLITAVETGLRARQRQLQVRDLLQDRELADRRKDEFLAMLAHELRNPLAPLNSAVSLMRLLDVTDPDLIETREILDRQVRHLARLVDDLLDVSRITRGTIELRKKAIDLVEVARQTSRIIETTVKVRGLEFLLTLPAESLPILADPTRIEQVISNILTNAARYTEPGGIVHLSIESQPGFGLIRVRDTGIGIDAETLPRVFELFTQAARPLDRSQGGLGIGLTIVKRLVELHGGTVEISSEGPGKGTEVLVCLPLQANRTSLSKMSDHVSTSSSEGRALRILVVEDNHDSADLMARYLRRKGYKVLVAYDGTSALKLVPEYQPQVVLTDIGLPGIDGYEIARRLRHDPKSTTPMLVAITGYGRKEDSARAKEAGFDHHFTKPIDLTQLESVFGALEPI